jgi:uncharacterized repeat protein (TIGR01451 family)
VRKRAGRKTVRTENVWNGNDRKNIGLTASEERVNVDRRWLGTSVVRVRVLVAGLVVLAAGCAVLGWGSRSRQTSANAAAQLAAIEETATAVPSLLATAQELPSLPSGGTQSRAQSLFAGLPLIFEPNQGQRNLDPADPRAKFVTHGSGYSLCLGSEGAILSLVSRDRLEAKRSKGDSRKHEASAAGVQTLKMKLAGANPNATVSGAELLPGKSNYLLGNDPAKWRSGVPQFARVKYESVYPGIDLVFYGNQGRLEYDFQVAPGSDPSRAELEFNGAKGLELKNGALVIKGDGGSVQLDAPRVYQEIAGRQQEVEGSFILRGINRAGFEIGAYDHSRELIIDPVLNFASYFGGSGDEGATSVAVDGSFNIYLTGSTTSPNLPGATTFPIGLVPGVTQDVYVAKITPPLGSNSAILQYVTYLGGDGADTPVGIKVDGANNPYVAGTTLSANFPTTATNAFQKTPVSAGTHVFVTELRNDAAALLYSSYLSGNGTDTATGMTIDAFGNLYVTGTTTSTNTTGGFPASNLPEMVPFQNASRASTQFFVTKVNTTAPFGESVPYSTYFGGGAFETTTTGPVVTGGGIAVDVTGNVYFTGTTNFIFSGCSGCSGTDFPILNPYQPCLDQPPPATIVNPPSCASVTSATEPDAFVAKLNLNPTVAQGQQLVWSTYLGGTGTDSGTGIALDVGAANVYVTGTTDSTDIGTSTTTLITSAAYQRCLDQPVNPTTGTACTPPATPYPNDAFVARFTNPTTTNGTTPTNVALNYFSYLGGTQDEAGLAITVDAGSGAIVTGWTQSPDFPVFPNNSSFTGGRDAFAARLNAAAVVGQTTTASWANYFGGAITDSSSILTEGTSVALDVNQNSYFAGDTNSTTLQVQKQLVTSAAVDAVSGYNGGYDAFVTQVSSALSLSISGVLTLGTNQTFISAGNQATFTYTVTNNGPDLASNITVTDNLSALFTSVPLTFVSASVSSGTCGGVSTNSSISCSLPPLQSGSTATITIVVTPTPNSAGSQATFNGGTVQAMGPGNIVLAQTSVAAQMSDFSIKVSPPNNSVVQAGNTATYQVVLSPSPVYSSPISLGCTGLPTGASCNFTTNPVTLAGPGSSTLNITTTARPVVTPAASLWTRHFYAIWLAVPGLTLLGVGSGRRRRRILGILSVCALFALLLLQPACGGTSTQAPVSGTPAGIYTITVNATAGSDTKSQNVTLQVP